jgi:predicted hotdog family 3-hydroxylacyl-ACP dehydratase
MGIEKNILSLIPQQPPFVMVDALSHSDETVTRSQFLVKAENVLTINGQFTEAGLLENIAQTAAARAGYIALSGNQPVKAGYIASIKNFEVFFLPQVNDTLVTEIKMEEPIFNVTMITGTVQCNGQLAAQCEMKIFMEE